jgi:DNA-binding CsgD family transcriptional regulator
MAEGALGRREACERYAAISAERAPPGLDLVRAYMLGGLGLAALARGDLERARGELEEAIRLRPALHVDWPGFPARTDLAEVLIRLGDPEAALPLLAAFEEARTGFPLALAGARRCRLMLAPDAELDGVARAAVTAIEGRSPFEEARTRLAYGERLRRAGRRVDARVELERARALFAGLGAESWAERARHELETSALRLRSPGPQADGLTPQELRVARAVAEGRSNRQVAAELFISSKTVEVHLSRVYRKLEITSRSQLARLAARDPGALDERGPSPVGRAAPAVADGAGGD